MVTRGLGLKNEELREFGIASLDSLLSVLLLSELCGSQVSSLEDLSCLASLLFLDIVKVGVAKETENAEGQQEVAFALIVEGVGLVPVGKHSFILVGQRGAVALVESVPFNAICNN